MRSETAHGLVETYTTEAMAPAERDALTQGCDAHPAPCPGSATAIRIRTRLKAPGHAR
jgi:hypothetical protein